MFLIYFLLSLGICDGIYNGNITNRGLRLIKKWEGFLAYPRPDLTGPPNIGHGHNCHTNCEKFVNQKYPVPLTRKSANQLLKDELVPIEECVKDAVKFEGLNANQYSALVSFTYNINCTQFRSSTLLKLLNEGDISGASKEFGRWYYKRGKPLLGLKRRRKDEVKLFNQGQSQALKNKTVRN